MKPGDQVAWSNDHDSQRRFLVRHIHDDGTVSVEGSDEGKGRLPQDELEVISNVQ